MASRCLIYSLVILVSRSATISLGGAGLFVGGSEAMPLSGKALPINKIQELLPHPYKI
jgi:hypothetical protein